jgi:hypothetical protein
MTKKISHPQGTLKKLVDAGKKDTRALGSVERWLLAQPKDTSRPTNVIHPSAMVKDDWCHKAEYYALKGAQPAEPKFRAGMQRTLTFEEGHRIHDRWQTWFWKMGHLYGVFRCTLCRHDFWALSPLACEKCDSSDFLVYREVTVSSPEHRISGHADGWLMGLGDDLLLEVKSVGEGTFRWEDKAMWANSGSNFKKAWADLKGPFQSHIAQAQVYMKLLEIEHEGTGTPTPQEALFIYESKVDQQVKEFVVRKSDFGTKELFEAAAMINKALNTNTPPACNIDPSGKCWKCEGF